MRKICILGILLVFLLSCNSESKKEKINMYIIPNELNLDTIFINKEITRRINIKNIGDNTLKLYSVSSDCGCTIAKIKDSIIDPKQDTFIEVKILPEVKGRFERSIVIKSNIKEIFSIVDIKGFVKKRE